MAIAIFDFRISEDAADHIWRHRISRDQLYELLGHRWVSIANRKGRVAKWVVIGRDNNGRCIAVQVGGDRSRQQWSLYRGSSGADRRPHGLAADHRLVLQAV